MELTHIASQSARSAVRSGNALRITLYVVLLVLPGSLLLLPLLWWLERYRARRGAQASGPRACAPTCVTRRAIA